MDNLTAYCVPGHIHGSKPYAVPVAGNNDREVPLFLAYHGREYLAADGTVTRHPVRMTFADTTAAIAAHEATLAPTSPTTHYTPDCPDGTDGDTLADRDTEHLVDCETCLNVMRGAGVIA